MLRLKYNNKEGIIMNKKSYLVIIITILVFVITIVAIILSGNNKDWTTDIKKAQNYQMIMTDCNNIQKEIANSALEQLSNKWSTLSNNGPWTGDSSACYTTLTISYETEGIVRQKQIIIIDESTLVLDSNTSTIYYTNAEEVVNYLNSLF